MSFFNKQSWSWRAVFVGAAFAGTALVIGMTSHPVSAQYYAYPGPGYTYYQVHPQYPSYDDPYYGGGYRGPGDGRSHRHWGEGRWDRGDWRHGNFHTDQGRERNRGRNDGGRMGSSQGGSSPATSGASGDQSNGSNRGGGPAGSSNSWLGSHGSYR
jgi:hypothetical protein